MTAARTRTRRTGQVPVEELSRFGGGWVGPFAQMIVVGLAITALALPVVTLPAAMAAGVRNLDRHLAHRSDSLASLLGDTWQAVSTGWWVGVGWAAITGALVVNVQLALITPMPLATAVAVVSALAALALTVLVLRAAARWHPGRSWKTLLEESMEDCLTQRGPTAIVLTSLAVAGVLVWMLPPLVVITPGMVALALLAAHRDQVTTASGP